LLLAADLGTAMRTGVEERTHHAVMAAHEDQRPTADLSRTEFSGALDLRLVPQVEPRSVEDAGALALEHVRVHERAPIHPEAPGLGLIGDVCRAIRSHDVLLGGSLGARRVRPHQLPAHRDALDLARALEDVEDLDVAVPLLDQ